MDKRVLVITGPTATGKTALGIELAKRLGGEIISADSMQLYRGMDIGTAKVSPSEMQGIPHHLIDVAEPDEDWSVARWVNAAAAIAEDIFARGKVPIIVGGTNLYIDSLLSGRSFAEKGDGALREALGREYDAEGGEKMLEKLAAFDPERAKILAPQDRRRIVRAMEIYALTGKTITEHDAETRKTPPRYTSLRMALSFADREKLYARIDRRVDSMMACGLVREVESLLDRGVPRESTAMQAIGYKEIVEALEGKCSLDEAVAAVKQGSRRYAKRQLTWLRRDKALRWIVWENEPEIALALRLSTEFIESAR